MQFKEVATVFDAIEKVSGRLEIMRLLAQLLKDATPQEAAIICNLSLGQLHPPYIGTQFNLAEKNVVKVLAQLLGKSEDAIAKEVKTSGDVGLIFAPGMWQPKASLTILQVYNALNAIEQMGGTGSQEEKIDQLVTLLKQLDPIAAKYVVRIVLGKLRLGFSDMTIIDALSYMEAGDKSLRAVIEDAYNSCVDIGLIVTTLKEKGPDALRAMRIHVGIPIRPAAAERLPSAAAIIEKLGPSIAQPKLDGLRLQVHVDNSGKKPKIHFFSRHLQDMSQMFPDLVVPLLTLPVNNIIFEGEAIGYDPNTGSFLPFQETIKRKRKHGVEQAATEFPLKLFVFDLLYLNGQDLMSKTHEERRAIMATVFPKQEQATLMVIEEYPVTTAKELEMQFTHAIAEGLEGLVVKRPDALYQPGKRNFNWIKLKRQEEGHLEDTIDCVILGYYSGEGKRAQFGIGAFLVGVYNEKNDCYETVAKIGTGLKDAEWIELKKRCDKIAVAAQPHNVVCAKELVPDVWTDPAIVCVVLADEITLSPVHAANKTTENLGFALRFPRFIGYSIDKGPQEATTAHEVERLYEDQFVRS